MRSLKNKNLRFLIITLIILLLMGVLSQGQNSFFGALNLVPLGLFELSASAKATPDSASSDEAANEKESAKYREKLVDYLELTRENERLRRYFGLSKNNPGYKLKPAEVIARDPDDDFYSFTLNVGESDGVSADDPVITENGLVGFVSWADKNCCEVKTVLSPLVKVGAADKQSGDRGVMCGSAELCGENLTSLTLIDEHNNIKTGDIIVTTGEGGICPKNVIIGRVTETKTDPFDSARRAVIKPYEEIKCIESAAVITDFSGKGEVVVTNR